MFLFANCEYNVVPEVGVLLLAVIFFILMTKTQPRRTQVFNVNYWGMGLSIITILCNLAIYFIACHTQFYEEKLFQILILTYFLTFVLVLYTLFHYLLLLSPQNREENGQVMWWEPILAIGFLAFLAYYLFTGKMYEVRPEGIHFFKYYYGYLYYGILNALFCSVSVIYMRKYITRIVRVGIAIAIPLELLLLITQLMDSSTVFIGAVYVIPFLIFYMLFHSNPYNEQIGCQNRESFESCYEEAYGRNEKFALLYVKFSRMKVNGIYERDTQLEYITIDKCRKTELLGHRIRIYHLNDTNYVLFFKYRNQSILPDIVEKIEHILEEPLYYKSSKIMLNYKLLVMTDEADIDNVNVLNRFLKKMIKRMSATQGNETYWCTPEDYEENREEQKISALLLDIRNQNNLNDPRVLAYAQPIYTIETGMFRSAEALVRLDMDGVILGPDKFIPLAEQLDCIHTFTCIMLNKVCKQILEMGDDYCFDAITINCSTLEMKDDRLHKELMNIIRSNGIDSSKIRLELTESATVHNLDTVVDNMEALNRRGVRFYLDDFGTGYSNLERIVSMPFMTIKFDKSILYKAMKDDNLRELVTSMVQIFKKKGMNMLIEGVENEEQTRFSIDTGFDYIQGYHFARPVPVPELTGYFQKA